MKHKSYGLDLISAVLGQIPSDWFRRARGRWVFRGHSDKNYSLIPSVGRVPCPANHRIKYESSLFNMFRREAREHVESLPSEWEWLALARHHGLPTRLLDWSNNPLIALYFAVEHHNSRDGELLALYAPRKASEKMIANASPFSIEKPYKYIPSIITPRIRAQDGLFVICADLENSLEECLSSRGWKLKKSTVPATMKEEIRYSLFRLGFHRSSLFPGLDGLSERIKWQHSRSSPPI